MPLVFPSRVDFQYILSDMYGSLNASPEAPSPLFQLPLPPFQTRVDKENASSGSQDLRLYLRMQANRRCYSAHSTTNLDPQQLPRSNETETISPIGNRLPSRPLPSARLPWSTEISRSASRKRGCRNEGGVCAWASIRRRAEGSATRPEGLPPGHPITAAACVGSVRDRPAGPVLALECVPSVEKGFNGWVQ